MSDSIEVLDQIPEPESSGPLTLEQARDTLSAIAARSNSAELSAIIELVDQSKQPGIAGADALEAAIERLSAPDTQKLSDRLDSVYMALIAERALREPDLALAKSVEQAVTDRAEGSVAVSDEERLTLARHALQDITSTDPATLASAINREPAQPGEHPLGDIAQQFSPGSEGVSVFEKGFGQGAQTEMALRFTETVNHRFANLAAGETLEDSVRAVLGEHPEAAQQAMGYHGVVVTLDQVERMPYTAFADALGIPLPDEYRARLQPQLPDNSELPR